MPRRHFSRLIHGRAARIHPEQVESRRVAERVSVGIEDTAQLAKRMGRNRAEQFMDHCDCLLPNARFRPRRLLVTKSSKATLRVKPYNADVKIGSGNCP